MNFNFKSTAILIKSIVFIVYIGLCVKFDYTSDELVGFLFGAVV